MLLLLSSVVSLLLMLGWSICLPFKSVIAWPSTSTTSQLCPVLSSNNFHKVTKVVNPAEGVLQCWLVIGCIICRNLFVVFCSLCPKPVAQALASWLLFSGDDEEVNSGSLTCSSGHVWSMITVRLVNNNNNNSKFLDKSIIKL